MYHPEQARPEEAIILIEGPVATAPSRVACLNEGCPCKDARIVSHRRAAFFAARARSRGQTAGRAVAVEADWSLSAVRAVTDAG
jgi:hypothetical protein